MTAVLDANLRSGFLHEELGILLLRGVAAVAPVPRPEDLGIDAICTLLGQTTSRVLTGRSSLYVQLKAKSISEVKYDIKDLHWISNLELPFFIATVDMQQARIRLFTLNAALAQKHFTAFRDPQGPLTLHLTPPPNGELPVDEAFLGDPILSWTLADQAAKILANRTAILEQWCAEERENIRRRLINAVNFLSWKENESPTRIGGHYQGGNSLEALSSIAPAVKSLALDAIFRKDWDAWPIWRTVLAVLRYNDIDTSLDHCEQLAQKEGFPG
jgi:hypothetical protein